MTNEKELEWYEQEPYMTCGPYSDYYHFDKIVAEAERRGESRAWESVRENFGMALLVNSLKQDGAKGLGEMFNKFIGEKLTSLKKV
jgi:hypothetical protein